MKKLLVLGLSVLGIGILGKISWDHLRHKQQTHILDTLHMAPSATTAPRLIKEIMGQSLDGNSLFLSAQTPPACQQFWRQVMGATLRDWLKQISEQGWNEPAACRSFVPATVIPLAQRATEVCSQASAFTPDCNLALLNYRTQLADEFYRETRNYVDMPLPLLLTKIYGQVLTEEQENKMPANELLRMVEALVQREPQFYPARKLALMALYTAQEREPDPDLKSSYNKKFNIELDQVKAMHGGQDSEISQMERSGSGERDVEPEEGEAESPKLEGHAKLSFNILNW